MTVTLAIKSHSSSTQQLYTAALHSSSTQQLYTAALHSSSTQQRVQRNTRLEILGGNRRDDCNIHKPYLIIHLFLRCDRPKMPYLGKHSFSPCSKQINLRRLGDKSFINGKN